jgi:hypothetical protein
MNRAVEWKIMVENLIAMKYVSLYQV